jgi:hypothetical protein
VLVEPADGFMAPATVRLYEKADLFRFHMLTVAEIGNFFKCGLNRIQPPICASYCSEPSKAFTSAGSERRIR